ncbi:response regulator [Pseudobacteriovorax antillogorgiicola]|uniref:Two-component system, chemotaxis family, response regulator CheY n=1 Tax=Pseudobacteriovorax antillogorgiicola TaxID=1513793 RepID=A0A1Y6B9L3_9BACT|nr:response regulator [Pseudobacteriovorax antillogorgiicola]TCS57521.1 two-component system chemotaxis response regulator CheY [Pseudobacteriovorax antillogorgiicola]SMF00102.1 two-component system, chemotaxis family, response regulator CheY [Pseudobacteriovorax antillogorgiicola]
MSKVKSIKPDRILIVDDDPDLLEVLQERFEQSDWKVDTANDGLKGLDIVNGKEFDVILSDIEMPQLNGIQFLSEIRGSEKNAGTVVVLMSGAFNQKDVNELLGYELGTFIEKPFSAEKILSLIEDALKRRSELQSQLESSEVDSANKRFKVIGED